MLMGVVVAMCLTVSIGAAFRIEGSGQGCQRAAKLPDHVLDHVIPADPECVAHQLGRQMPVAQVPGDPDQMGSVPRPDLHQVFRLGKHFNDAAIFQFQAVTMVQMHGGRLVQQKGQATFACQNRPAAMAVFPVKSDPVGSRRLPGSGSQYGFNPDHAPSFTLAIMALKAGRFRKRLK